MLLANFLILLYIYIQYIYDLYLIPDFFFSKFVSFSMYAKVFL